MNTGEVKINMKYYKEVVINPSGGGFGMYQAGEANGERWTEAGDLLSEISGNGIEWYELGEDELPEGLENIIGKIYNQPNRIFGWINDQGLPVYFGISEFEEERNE